ncbi:DUF3667 domain-containing protein [Chryseobacterium oncorhynchi]|uniref:DUF3667 domain-containing protein n=1 Tax=Chryseobacterium oncorhynchi TaxID=741074 RepID=A0A316WI31_9FLAO|nr:DUF3667 domain-containing protein [Chryseobacterium oncorhynchi]PWN60063.1 hypothetical protein C1638_021075 [Chryseobacterium oncorhynchi]
MEYNCPNCKQLITENFCSNCGQKKYKRIDREYIWNELQYSIFHTNKGFLYSIKNIIRNPGRTAKEFIDGNRINHYKPILLAFVLSSISAFISFKIIEINSIMREIYSQENIYAGSLNNLLSYLSSYNSLIMLLLIPIFAIFTKIAFKCWGQNYYEHIVMNAYILSCYTLINIILIYPVMYFFKNNVKVFIPISFLSIAIIPFILLWFYKGFYKEKFLRKIFLRVLLLITFFFICYVILIFGLLFYQS